VTNILTSSEGRHFGFGNAFQPAEVRDLCFKGVIGAIKPDAFIYRTMNAQRTANSVTSSPARS
jgi:hypothetical protein